MIYGNPFPSSPNIFSAGISTLSKAISAVSEAFQPNLLSIVADNPFEFLSTTKRLIPLYFSVISVFAATIK